MATSMSFCSLGKKCQTKNSETPYHQPIKTMTSMTGWTSRVFLENQPPIMIVDWCVVSLRGPPYRTGLPGVSESLGGLPPRT